VNPAAASTDIRAGSPATGMLCKAITKLKSLHDGDIGAIETIACGAAAIAPVRAILLAREPSGLYETRRRAVEVLTALKAYDVLREFLEAPHEFADPVEQTGEDAVVNAAARALGELGDTKDLPLLLALLRLRRLAGIIEAVGRFRRIEALPFFIDALADDFTRPAAEAAILNLGAKARHALFESVLQRQPPSGREVDSSRQRRRSALRLLLEIGVPGTFVWPPLHQLVHDPDPWVAMLAARLCLASKMDREKPDAIARLIELLKCPNTLLIADIEDCLTAHFGLASCAIEQAIETGLSLADPDAPWWLKDKALAALLQVKARHSTGKYNGGRPDGT
jgi:HEAT repeat protein